MMHTECRKERASFAHTVLKREVALPDAHAWSERRTLQR